VTGVLKSDLKQKVKIYHGKYVPVPTVNGNVLVLNEALNHDYVGGGGEKVQLHACLTSVLDR
jgi:hypothetical protein